jgi:hypothetical protein
VLAHYHASYDRQRKQLQRITEPQLYRTPFASPRLELWELDESQWLKVRERPLGARRVPSHRALAEQLPLAGLLTLILTFTPSLQELRQLVCAH